MTVKSTLIALSAVLLLSGSAYAQADQGNTEPAKKDAAIPFADFRGQIDDWREEGRNAILIKSSTGQWYRAEFMSPCHGLPFTETIGFPLDGTRRVDKFSSIILRGSGGLKEECYFKSFVEIPDPGKTKNKTKDKDKEAAPADGHQGH
jgi:hypothetical protein